MGYQDPTEMGGAVEVFLTTHWTLIHQIKSDEDKDRALINLMLERYWKPVYCYLRRKGYDNESAKDLTQGFLHEVVLNRELIHKADRSRGRFRSLLLTALNRYLVNIKESEMARTRIPPDKLVSLEVVDPPELQMITESNPDDFYHYVWLSALLEQVLYTVKTGCEQDGLEIHWQVFEDRVVRPILQGFASPSLSEVCQKYGIQDEKKTSNMIVTVKRRFHTALKEYVRSTVASDNHIQAELSDIFNYFSPDAQPDL
jgi:DNA-directed RNA polymerase specialized sigma24 family protein